MIWLIVWAGAWWVWREDSLAVAVVVAALVIYRAVRGPSGFTERFKEVVRARSGV